MLGIDYASSDEEEVIPATSLELTNITSKVELLQPPLSEPVPFEQPLVASDSINGPYQGPTALPPPEDGGPVDSSAPESPVAPARAMIQTLTLPTVPNFDIPHSPPGSPPQRATKKFAQFLELKKKGQHFNQRLETSSVLRDPDHSQKLLNFAGISEEDSYASTLSEQVTVPTIFPEWAYVEELRASQKRVTQANEQVKSKAPREAINFVSATKSGASSGTGTLSGKRL
ncbi:HCNGP-like protein-domain-containing protein [Pyrenochaeta sp. MPI-SDFR-AT-0127]|nr:HCNGP-like protein-domain-containing protein [Pyrenochaeta sp. MPI-SDFR-AT-0127]